MTPLGYDHRPRTVLFEFGTHSAVAHIVLNRTAEHQTTQAIPVLMTNARTTRVAASHK